MAAAATTSTRSAPRRKAPARSVAILEQPTKDTDGWGAIRLTVGQESATYLCRFIPCQLGEGILGLELEKLAEDLGGIEETYHVALDPLQSMHQCECKGFLRHNRCKHVDGVAKLVELGRLQPLTSNTPAASSTFSPGRKVA
jgi:hypothetical protein